jgi:hypothetical protein
MIGSSAGEVVFGKQRGSLDGCVFPSCESESASTPEMIIRKLMMYFMFRERSWI